MFWRAAATSAAILLVPVAEAQDGTLTLGGGLHYSSGDYGTPTTTTIMTLVGTAAYEKGPWTFKGWLPYLNVEGDSAVVPGIGNVRGKPSRKTSEAGLGDIVVSATYAAYYDRATTFGLDLSAKLKLATADENRGLGTGEHDMIFLADIYRTFGRWTGFGGIGYHILGDPPGFPLDNVWNASLGASYKLDERDSVGASLDGRERVAPGTSPQRELTGFFIRKLDRLWKAQLYALIGLANGSPDWGAGLSLARPF
jgi:hypothetical protein